MDKVLIERDNLYKAVAKNREQHVQEVKDATLAWRKGLIQRLSDYAAALANGDDALVISILPRPVSHAADYDRVIRMLEMSVEPNIELTQQEFDQYVMDNWSWAAPLKMMNQSYISGSAFKHV